MKLLYWQSAHRKEADPPTKQPFLPGCASRKLCCCRGCCAHHSLIQQLLPSALWVRGVWKWTPLVSERCESSSSAQDSATRQPSSPGSRALPTMGNKPLSCPISSPVLPVPWRACCRDLWASSKSSVSQFSSLTLGEIFTAFSEVLSESNWCLGWEEDVEMGRTLPSSSEQLDLLSCSGEPSCRRMLSYSKLDRFFHYFFFQPLTWQTKEGQEKRGFRTPACRQSVVGLSHFSV